MIALTLLASAMLCQHNIDIAKELGNRYWLDGNSEDTKSLEYGFIRLAKLPTNNLRKYVQAYLSHEASGQSASNVEPILSRLAGRAEAYKRAINIAVLNRLLFRDEMPLVADQWFGPDILSTDVIWDWRGSQPKLLTRPTSHWLHTSHGYSSLREFDALVKARQALKKKHSGQAMKRGFNIGGSGL